MQFYTFIINPAAGNGHVKHIWPQLEKYLETHNINYAVQTTKYPGHASQIVQELAILNPQPIMVVLGGDGTLHEALNGLQTKNLQATLAYIPCGSGNDFARGANIDFDPLKALQKIITNPTYQDIDIGFYHDAIRNNSAFFTNNLGIGFDANIVYLANHSYSKRLLNKHQLGFLAYAFSFFKAYFRQKTFNLTLTCQDTTYTFQKAFLCTITNHPYFGGGVCLMPKAKLNDGKLDVVIIEKKSTLHFWYLFLLMILPGHLHSLSKKVHHFQASSIRLETPACNHCHADGEDLACAPSNLTFTIKKQHFII